MKTGKEIDKMFNLMTHIGLSPYSQEQYSLCLYDYLLRVQPVIQGF